MDLPDHIQWFSNNETAYASLYRFILRFSVNKFEFPFRPTRQLSSEETAFLAEFSETPHRLRLPLHLALTISPIFLLIPVQLFRKDWDRLKLLHVSLAFSFSYNILRVPRLPSSLETKSLQFLLKLRNLSGKLFWTLHWVAWEQKRPLQACLGTSIGIC